MTRISDANDIRSRFSKARQRFAKDERGAVLVFALFLFIVMIMMGGLAVDLMRYEATRTTLQNTLDRSTLAAASLSQTLDPEDVVRDYFAKAGMTQDLQSVTVSEGLNYRNVAARAAADADPLFLHMIGVDEFIAPGASTAEQRVTNLEISLVLDVSGSMGGAKLANLKIAAKEFVDTVLSSDPDGRIAISIVPYNAQVNLGPVLRAKYAVTHDHGVADANCIEIPAANYGTVGLSNTTPMPMMAHADISFSTNKVTTHTAPSDTTYATANYSSVHCKLTTGNIVRLPSQSISDLKTQIDGLVASGNTSIMAGMRWGVSLLDPEARPMFTSLIAEGAMAPELADRPYDYGNEEVLKIVVLMTDGEHVSHTFVKDAFKTGASPIYKSTGDGNYSVFHSARSGNKYWVPHLSTWQAAAYNSGSGVVQQDWKHIWSNLRATYVAWNFYARATGTSSSTRNTIYDSKMNEIRGTFTSVSTMNSQLQQSCAAAKTKSIIVYGIAFAAPANGQQQIKSCTTGYNAADPNGSNAYYFAPVADESISDAFRTIATNISQLRLTQ